MIGSGGTRSKKWLSGSAAACAAMLSVAGCASLEEATEDGYHPAVAEEVEGSEVKLVTFQAEAAERVSLRTARVERSGEHTVVPYAALIYDPAGQVWVYASPKPLTFMRAPVTVDHIRGSRVWLTSGPDVGSRVVTVGATEVYGVELDIAGGH